MKKLRLMPNSRFTLIAIADNVRQLANVVERSPLYAQLKYSYFHQEICVQDNDLTPRLKFALEWHPDAAPPVQWRRSRHEYVGTIMSYAPKYTSSDEVSRDVYDEREPLHMTEFFGVPFGNTGANERLERNGSTGFHAIFNQNSVFPEISEYFLLAQLLRHEGQNDEVLKDAVESAVISDFNYDDPGDDFYDVDTKFNSLIDGLFLKRAPLVAICAHLKEKAQGELRIVEAKYKIRQIPNNATSEVFVGEHSVGELKRGKRMLSEALCNTCHDPDQGKPIGPHFHFRTPAMFARDNADSLAAFDYPIADKARQIMSDKVPIDIRMPLNHPDLDVDDQRAIVRYLQSMALTR